MDIRVYRLVDYLRTHDHATAAFLAEHFGVSARTVRTYVSKANDSLGGIARVVYLRGSGYVLHCDDGEALARLMSRTRDSLGRFPSTPTGRMLYLLDDLINRDDWITVGELARMLAVSEKTISSDLGRVGDALARFGLALERRPHYGVRVSGGEADRRLCLASIIVESERCPELILSATGDETISGIEGCVAHELGKRSVPISSVALRGLIVHIRVALQRIRRGCYVPMDSGLLERVRPLRAYEAASCVAARLSEEFGVDFPEQEVAYVAIQLASGEPLDVSGIAGAGAGFVVSDDVWGVISEMLDVVRDEFRFDLHGDIELRMNLARHIMPLALRLQYHVGSSNPLLDDIREHYPLAYLMALESSKVLVRHYGSMPSDDEIGYIALLIALGMERQRAQGSKKNVLIVCDVGPSGMELLAARCRREFGQHVGAIHTCDVSGLDGVDWSDIDYVFTTMSLERKLPVPACQVSVFLDDEDIRKVRGVFAGEPSPRSLSRNFSPELFLAHQVPSSKGELLEVLCDLLARHEGLSGEFLQKVLQREAAARTAFGNRTAIPHPIEPMGERTMVAVALLDRPIEWDGNPVQAVFLISVAQDGEGEINEFNREMADFLSDRGLIDQLIADQRYETLVRLLDAPADRAPNRARARDGGR